METLFNGICIYAQAGFPLGTDSVLLAQFLSLPKEARIADLGSGCGTLGLLLCARDKSCRITGIELNATAHAAALENIRKNNLADRLSSLSGDVRRIAELLPAGSFDRVISNPPYFPAGSGKLSKKNALARSEESLTLPQLCKSAAYLLPSGGRFALVHRPERLCDVFCAMREAGIEPKRIQLVRHKECSPLCLVLIEGRRGGKAGLKFEPDFIEFTPDGKETDAYRAAYGRGDIL